MKKRLCLFSLMLLAMPLAHGSAQTVADAQNQAVARYPDLGREGSPLHQRFLELYHQVQETDPALLSNPDWPLILADQAYSFVAAGSPSPAPSPEQSPAATPQKLTAIPGTVAQAKPDASPALTLSPQDKARIRAEEIFRHEVEREIRAESSAAGDGDLWTALNSAFVLWLLSSVVLGGLAAGIAIFQQKHSERMRRIDLQRRLNVEISSRIAEGLIALRLGEKRIAEGRVYYLVDIYRQGILYLDNRVTDGPKLLDFSIFPEYRARAFLSLIFELSSVAEESARTALRDARSVYSTLEDLADHAAVGADYTKPPPPDKGVMLGALNKSLELLNRLEIYSFWRPQL